MENNTMLSYPDMSPPLLETIMRLTIEKVKIQRSPPQSQSPRPVNDYQSQRLTPFSRSKSNSLLRTLLIIQVGRKTSRLLSLISQPEVYQRTEQTPAHVQQPSPVQLQEKQQPKSGGKRRSSSDDEEVQSEDDSTHSFEEDSCSTVGPSLEKSPCLEEVTKIHSGQISSEESGSLSDMTNLSPKSPSSSSSNISYNENCCPGCQCCSIWLQKRQESSNFQLCEPVRQC
ncbi:unnamed protein product [Rodentolepis nana]|uniref:ORF3 n=1 Tax=Rodentolepis nana TaxID=102285 RepID=A0A0R3T5Z9_RODNA|nr:unnamed protein product [Rodentolepis nana]